MSNSYIDTALLDKAIAFATRAHANTERRGKNYPFIIHPLEAVAIVSTITSDQELLAAAALHDTVEDTDVTISQIEAEFGPRIAALVDSESERRDPNVSESESWHDRKAAAIDCLAHASYDSKIVALGDKLSNIRAIARDYRRIGDRLWDRFHAPNGKADHEWHYRGLAVALFDLASTDAYKEFASLIDQVFGPMDLTQPHPISLDDYERSGEGFCAVSYNHKGGHTMVKLYDTSIPYEDTIQELTRASNVYHMGVPTPMPGRLVTDGERYGLEFEQIVNKQSFSRAICDHPDQLESITSRFAAMCKKLHSTPCDTRAFEPASRFYRDLVIQTKHLKDYQKDWILKFLDTVPEAQTCLHGDMHIGNVITTGEEDFWIDLGDFRWGYPLFDLGMLYLMCNVIPDDMKTYLFHLSPEQMSKVWKIFIRDYFQADTPEKMEEAEQKVLPFVALKAVHLGDKNGLAPFLRKAIDDGVKNIF